MVIKRKTSGNYIISSICKAIISEKFNLDYVLYNTDEFIKYFYKYCSIKNNKFQDNLIKFMEEKFVRVGNIKNCKLSNLVYIYTYKNKIVYIGKTKYNYNVRLETGYSEQTFGKFKELYGRDDANWKFYIYQANNKQSIDELEAYLINWFASHEVPILNSKCEDISGLFSAKMNKRKNK